MDSETGKSVLSISAILGIIGLCVTLAFYSIEQHERLARMESIITSEATLCDCFQTRSRVTTLEHRVAQLENELTRLRREE